jgi:hypothetical protein
MAWQSHPYIEIIRLPALTQVPQALPSVVGITNLRDSIVPVLDLRRRYARSLANLPRARALSDHALIFDNSSIDGYQLLLEWADEHVISRASTLLHRLQDHLGDLLGQMPESR